MPSRTIGRAFLLVTFAVSSSIARADDAPLPDFQKDILPLVATYCTECHNAIDHKGDLDLERFETKAMVADALALWQRAAMRVEKHEMPPSKFDRKPTDEERKIITTWAASLRIDNATCDAIANDESANWFPGYVMSRRLNRNEYENTVRDLLGVNVSLAQLFPADGAGGEGFDNNGAALFLSSIQIEKYLDAADLALDAVFPPTNPVTGQSTGDAQVAQPAVALAPGSSAASPRDAARQTIAAFAERAWRRPVQATEVDRLMSAFDRAAERGDGYDAGLRLAMKAVLISPHFLFLAEPEPARGGVYQLGDYPLAARMSYLFWSSMPDDELRTLASAGKLNDEATLRAQITRMLRDEKANALGEFFAEQWLGVNQLAEITRPDANRYPEFTDDLAAAMREEVSMVFNRIVREDRSLLELIDADYTYANEALAALYGIGGVTGPELQLVPVPDKNRGGVLGMAAVLTQTSHPLRTSPVLRGKWVLEQLLGDHVPPPPPNVPKLPDDERQFTATTLRAQLEQHRSNPDCAGCHSRMDPLGFGLENFDPIGRWRTDAAGQPIDSVGQLPSGEKFSGPAELKQVLMAHKDEFARNLSRKMLGYALGRSLTAFDECVIDRCVEALQKNEYKPSAMFNEIVLSYPFRHRFSGHRDTTEAPASARSSE